MSNVLSFDFLHGCRGLPGSEKEAEEKERKQQEEEAAEKDRIWKERLDMEAARRVRGFA